MRGSRIVILGVAYKADVDDIRESPALDIISLLRQKGADVSYIDPLVPAISLENDERMVSLENCPDLLKAADCVVIVTDHAQFDWPAIVACSRVIVDTRNVLDGVDGPAKIVSL